MGNNRRPAACISCGVTVWVFQHAIPRCAACHRVAVQTSRVLSSKRNKAQKETRAIEKVAVREGDFLPGKRSAIGPPPGTEFWEPKFEGDVPWRT